MKHLLKIILPTIIALTFTLASCKKPAEHSIRIQNNSSVPFQSIAIKGSAVVFTDVKANSVTEYKSIPEGSYTLSGDLTTETAFEISGNGVHKWSIKIGSDKSLSVVED